MDSNKIHLFVYGKLQPWLYPPTTMSDHKKDKVIGKLYELGNDPLILPGKTDQVVHGYLLTIDRSELPSLDKAESGYKRTRILTQSGVVSYIYLWDGPLPKKARPIESWPKGGPHAGT